MPSSRASPVRARRASPPRGCVQESEAPERSASKERLGLERPTSAASRSTLFSRSAVSHQRMKYSPQQQQQEQKERKSESEMSSVNATPSRAASALQRSASAASAAASQSTSAARRVLSCRPLSSTMFAWMRVFRLANMLHQVGC